MLYLFEISANPILNVMWDNSAWFDKSDAV